MTNLSKLNKTADKILRNIIQICKMKSESGDYYKIDNNQNYLPLIVEFLDTTTYKEEQAEIFLIAHYGEMNGDLMADPSMEFLITKDAIYPISYRNDYAALNGFRAYTRSFNLDNNIFFPKAMKEQTQFANMWLNNIKMQQNIKMIF